MKCELIKTFTIKAIINIKVIKPEFNIRTVNYMIVM